MTANTNTKISKVLQNKKLEIADIFANALYLSPRWKATLDIGKSNWNAFLKEEFFAYVDYLSRYFASSNDETYKNLFLGEKLKSLYDRDLDTKERRELAKKIETYEVSAFEALLKTDLGNEWDVFIKTLKEINNIIVSETTNQLHIVFVGDCLFLDILPFIIGPLIKDGISIHASYVASKNPMETRDELKKLASKKIDLIFFSPFTYDFSPNLVTTQRSKTHY